MRSIEEKIAAGEHYDAQQLVKTVHRRLCAKGECSSAADFCVQCARRFSTCGQHDLAADLGKDVVASYESSKAPTSDSNLKRIEKVLDGIPAHAAVVPKYALLQRALRWSAYLMPHGHPRLHRLAANSYWAEEEYGKCQAHLVYCGDGLALANFVQEWRLSGYPNEQHLFSLRTLFILLSLNDLVTARQFWDAVNWVRRRGSAASSSPPASRPAAPVATDASMPSAVSSTGAAVGSTDSRPYTPAPPVQCGSLLLAAAEAGNLSFFRTVRGKYALVIRRDATFDKYLDEIEVRVFATPAQRGGLGAIFEALLSGSGNDSAGTRILI